MREPEEVILTRVRFCGPRRTQFRTLLLALNRSTRLSEIKTGRVGAIGIDGRAPKIEGDESEERVFHSAKGFMLVEGDMKCLVVIEMVESVGERRRTRDRRWRIHERGTTLKYFLDPTGGSHSGGTKRARGT